MIKEGINRLKNKMEYKDTIDEIEYFHYKNIILSLNDKIVYKRVILKDATASFIQNLIRLRGYKDENSLKVANLYSTDE